MERNAGVDPTPEDDEDFVVAQEAEFEEPYLPADDDERELDEVDLDDVDGVDAERRVSLNGEPGEADGAE